MGGTKHLGQSRLWESRGPEWRNRYRKGLWASQVAGVVWRIGPGERWNILLFPVPDEDLAPAVGHDETDAEEVVDGLEAAGGDVALWRGTKLAFWWVWRL